MIEKAKAHGAGNTGALIGAGHLNSATTSTNNHQNHQAATVTSSAFTDFTLAAIRCERARTALRLNTIDAAGIGLRAGLISPDCAIAMIEEVDVGVMLTIPSSLEAA